MGVDGLYRFINKNFPDIYNTVNITEIKGKSCIIDGIQHIYSQLIYMRSRDKEVITLDGKNISHIHGLINSLRYYLKNKIIPIFIFDGKTPNIKIKKIEERRKNLKENLLKLKNLEEQKNNIDNYLNLLNNSNLIEKDEEIIFGTPPIEVINIEEEEKIIIKRNNLQNEYKQIYKKSIIMKNYYIEDWIEILQYLGIPVIKAPGEADPLCAFLLKNNPDIFGIISDDSDMLIFGAQILMRKSVNQNFIIIELKKILDKIEYLLLINYNKHIKFDIENLIDYSILLGTDYGVFKLNINCNDSLELLKYYVSNDKDYKKLISPDQYINFDIIKKYYMNQQFNNDYNEYLVRPKWNKPKFMELKKRLLELNVDEDYIDRNNEFFDLCYNRIKKNKFIFKNNYNNIYRIRSNSFDDNIKSHKNNKYFNIINDDHSKKIIKKTQNKKLSHINNNLELPLINNDNNNDNNNIDIFYFES